MNVVVRYWAAARAAAGCSEEEVAAGTLTEILAAAVDRHGSRLAALLPACSILLDGVAAGSGDRSAGVVSAGAVVDVLPPFAGGAR